MIEQPGFDRHPRPEAQSGFDEVLREAAPRVLAAVVRRYGHFDTAEDAVQEALLAASAQWPQEGVPQDPAAWLIRVASRRLIDQLRSDSARVRREEALALAADPDTLIAAGADEPTAHDDTVRLLFLCCHASLTPASQVALTLRAVGGLTTPQIARGFLVPESSMAQRIVRAKGRIRAAGATFEAPAPDQVDERMRAVLHVLYLIFNEGHTATSGPDLVRTDLTTEAIRLTRLLHRARPDDGEVTGLLALMLLTDSRRDARVHDGELVPLDEQDRSRWDQDAIAEGVALITDTLRSGVVGPYQLQAAIAAVHAEAPNSAQTDWPQIAALYRLLAAVAPGPAVRLNQAVAVGMADGPRAGLAMLAPLLDDAAMASHHRLYAVRAHLLERAGDLDAARDDYRRAAQLTTSEPEQRYLARRADALGADGADGAGSTQSESADCAD